MAARGGLANSAATRAALLDAAQELFSSEGIDGTSMRAIQRVAGLAPGTIQYHFASREDLLRALIAREEAGLNRQVAERAAALLDGGQPVDGLSIVEALATPYVAFIKKDPVRAPQYIRVLAQLARQGDPLVAKLVGELRALFPELLARAYPKAEPAEARAALVMAARALLFMLAADAVDEVEKRPARQAEKMQNLLRFVAGGLDAVLLDAPEKPQKVGRIRR